MSVRIGTQHLAATTQADGRYQLTVQIITSLSEVTEKLFINGLPLTLAQYDDGDYVLCAVVETDVTDNSDYSMFDGCPLTIERQGNQEGQYILATEESSSSVGTRSYTMFNGYPLAISENNELIFKLKTGTVTSYVDFFLGSLPLRAALIDSNYYLLISLN